MATDRNDRIAIDSSRYSSESWTILLCNRTLQCYPKKCCSTRVARCIRRCTKIKPAAGKLTSPMCQRMPFTRREMLISAALGLVTLPTLSSLAWPSRRKTFDEPKRNPYRGSDDQLLDEIERAAFDFFWNEAGSTTGQVRDRALLKR